ncbi:hypothetical protein CkP1_0082 [Citrobacter phage CkP1]|nr:hypothetical protein CkP1_0082 [Citrobacter phage CkP1]
MNPFKQSAAIAESEAMKALFKELREVHASICLQHAVEFGEKIDMNFIHNSINASTAFDIVYFKSMAAHKLSTQPENSLPTDERIAVAAHEAYKEVIK